MKITDLRYEKIKQTVVNVLQKTNLSSYPINCFELCYQLHIKIKKYSERQSHILELVSLSEDAFCCYKEKSGYSYWEIWYNDKKDINRIRFSIFHEIGHICLDHFNHEKLAEAEANFFAAYIIILLPLLNILNITNNIQIAKIFLSSKECANNAINRLYKWLKHRGKYYKDYEKKLLCQIKYIGKFCVPQIK